MNGNNVLSNIPGEFRARRVTGCRTLRSALNATQRIVVRLPDGARYEVTFLRLRSTKGKPTRWFWTPDSPVAL